MAHVDEDSRLRLAAVGLWHKLRHLYGWELDAGDVLTAHPNPHGWGPLAKDHDLDGPLTELFALGYAEAPEQGRVRLHEELDEDDMEPR